MELLIRILFFLGVILGPATYTQSEFDQMVFDNEPAIEEVQEDPAAMQIVNSLEPPEIVILEDDGESQ